MTPVLTSTHPLSQAALEAARDAVAAAPDAPIEMVTLAGGVLRLGAKVFAWTGEGATGDMGATGDREAVRTDLIARLREHDNEPRAQLLAGTPLYELDVNFPPTYPMLSTGGEYLQTRCPAWCDRVLMVTSATFWGGGGFRMADTPRFLYASPGSENNSKKSKSFSPRVFFHISHTPFFLVGGGRFLVSFASPVSPRFNTHVGRGGA